MRTWIALSALALAACAAETVSPPVPDHWEMLQGTAQRGVPGADLDSLVRLRLVDASGHPVAGVATTWSVVSGGGALPFSTSLTDAEGVTSAEWRLGLDAGPQSLGVIAPGMPMQTVGVSFDLAEFGSLAVGNSFACGLDREGVAWCWGGNFDGTLGVTEPDWSAHPLRIGDGSLRFAELVAGGSHACGREGGGAVWCWGDNYAAQLGQGGTGSGSAVTLRVAGLPDLVALDAEETLTCGLTVTGKLWCWGSPFYNPTYPVATSLHAGTVFKRIALGNGFGCGITDDDHVTCWGNNDKGQLGRGTTDLSDSALGPIAVPLLARELDAGNDGACVITTAHDVYCWGVMQGIRGHRYDDASRSLPTLSAEDSPALRLSLGYWCGAIWQSPSDPRMLCPGGWTTDLEALPGIIEVEHGWYTLCLRAAGGVTYCKNYSDSVDPEPFALYGVAITAAPSHP